MAEGLRARGLGALATVGLRRPGLLLAIVGLLMVVAGVVLPGLGVSTSRTGLISDDDPVQASLLDFYGRFGRPESMVFLISGGEAEQRRAIVDALEHKLSAEPGLEGRVLARVDAEVIAPVLLLQQPEALVQLRRQLPPDTDLPALVEGGLPAWLKALEDQIYGQLEDADDEAPGAEAAGSEAARGPPAGDDPLAGADQGLKRLAMLAQVLDAVLVGEDPLARLGEQDRFAGQPGVDERGYSVTSDGHSHLLTVFPELPSDEGRDVAPLVERVRAIRGEVMAQAPEGIVADVTGMPALITDELVVVEDGLKVSSASTTLGIALLCLLLFRSLRQTLIALLPLAPGVLLTLAAVRLLYSDLNIITSSFVAVLLGLGIDFSVHAISRYNEEIRGGVASEGAVRAAMERAGPGVITGAVVTATAFLTTATTEFTAFGELGVVTAIGLVVIVVANFLLLPALLRGRGQPRVAPEPPGLAAVPGLVRRLRIPILLAGIGAAVAGGVVLDRVGFNPRYFDFMPENTEGVRALARLEYEPLVSPVFANVQADSIEQARAMTEQLRALESVAGVQSPTDLLPPLSPEALAALRAGFDGLARDPEFSRLAERQTTPERLAAAAGGVVDALEESQLAMLQAGLPTATMDATIAAFKALRDRAKDLDEAGRARLAALEARAAAMLGPAWTTARAVAQRGGYLPTDVPPLFAHRFVALDGEGVAMYAVPSGKFWESDVAARFYEEVSAVDPRVSGLATVNVRHGEIILEGFRRAAGIAAVLVVIILALDFRSLKDALLALVPTAVGWLWMVGIMVLAGIRFDVANVVCMPLVLGIGIAFGVHMMHRCREEERQGGALEGRLDTVIRGTGGAIAVAALTTMVGFGGLTMADYGGMKSFGGLMIIGIGACLVATVLLLPALLLVLRRVK